MAVCLALVAAVVAVFAQTTRYDFVNFDDNQYVYENVHVLNGLTARGLAWAFNGWHVDNWHPLTWLSHMLDCQLFGPAPGGHHATNLLLHAATAIALFLVLRSMTGRLWPSAFVAAVFAVHPLHVESVAWISERKDVLSGLFFVLTLGAYTAFVRRPFSILRYALVGVLLALGLMSKPMLVTLPCLLLLLDYWPLGRISSRHAPRAVPGDDMRSVQSIRHSPSAVDGRHTECAGYYSADGTRSVPATWQRLLLEKLPLFLLVAGSCVATQLAQHGAIIPVDALPVSARIGNAVVAYVAYLGQMFCPLDLAVYYPHPLSGLPIWKVVAASVVLLGISTVAVLLWRRMPYLFVGWFWYIGMLVPVIGLVQVGAHAMADRYAYLPHIGLYIAVTWAVADLLALVPRLRRAFQVAAAAAILLLTASAWRQTSYWRDGFTLWSRALQCTRQNAMAHNNLGYALAHRGEPDAAIEHYEAALSINPKFAWALNNLGTMLARRGDVERAGEYFTEAIKYQPGYVDALCNLGNVFVSQGRPAAAIEYFQAAIELKPDSADARTKLGNARLALRDLDAAVENYRIAIQLDRRHADAHGNLSLALMRQGKPAEALNEKREYLRLRPNDAASLNDLAWTLATHTDASIRNGPEAVELAQRAVRLSNAREPALLGTLAAAYAEAGRFTEASQTARQAADLAERQNHPALAAAIRAKVVLYEAKTPFHESATPPSSPSQTRR